MDTYSCISPVTGVRSSASKDEKPRPLTPRLETASTHGLFRRAFSSARTVIPMTGHHEGIEDGGVLSIATLLQTFEQPLRGRHIGD